LLGERVDHAGKYRDRHVEELAKLLGSLAVVKLPVPCEASRRGFLNSLLAMTESVATRTASCASRLLSIFLYRLSSFADSSFAGFAQWSSRTFTIIERKVLLWRIARSNIRM